MKVLLTHGYFIAEDEKEQKIMKPYPPLGILYLAAWLDRFTIDNEVYDTTFSTKAALKEHLVAEQPDAIGIYINLMTKLNVLDIIKFAKEALPKTQIFIGGPDVRYNAEHLLQFGADYVVIGEGEETTLELIQYLRGEGTPTPRELITGIAYLDEQGTYTENAERQKMRSINDLPFPAREKIDMHAYFKAWRDNHGQSAMTVSTMRGCPYTCKWCSRAVYGLSYRRRSPELVAEELAYIQEHFNPDSVWFVDDVFTVSHKWLEAFRDALQEKKVTIPYECITRADRMNEEVINVLKESGCFRVWIGAESGSQKVIDLMDRRVDVNTVREMIQLSQKKGIEAGTFIMLGYPGETEEDIEETIHHLKISNPDHFTITVAYPIKGTELYEETEELQNTHLDWAASTDRDIDFDRAYPRRYYNFAVAHVINEVYYHKARLRSGMGKRALAHKLRATIARAGMWWVRATHKSTSVAAS